MTNEERPSMSELVAMRQRAEKKHRLRSYAAVFTLALVLAATIMLIVFLFRG